MSEGDNVICIERPTAKEDRKKEDLSLLARRKRGSNIADCSLALLFSFSLSAAKPFGSIGVVILHRLSAY